jgi:hypothetical protein
MDDPSAWSHYLASLTRRAFLFPIFSKKPRFRPPEGPGKNCGVGVRAKNLWCMHGYVPMGNQRG